MRTAPSHREGATFGGMPGKVALALGVTALGVAAVVALRTSGDPPSSGIVRIEGPTSAAPAIPVTAPPAPVGARMVYELHGISPGGMRPTALLAPHGATPRSYAVGESIGPGVELQAIARGHVLLREGTEVIRIDLPPRLGGSGEAVAPAERGLKPEPQPPTGELSAAQITANGGAAPQPLPGDDGAPVQP